MDTIDSEASGIVIQETWFKHCRFFKLKTYFQLHSFDFTKTVVSLNRIQSHMTCFECFSHH